MRCVYVALSVSYGSASRFGSCDDDDGSNKHRNPVSDICFPKLSLLLFVTVPHFGSCRW